MESLSFPSTGGWEPGGWQAGGKFPSDPQEPGFTSNQSTRPLRGYPSLFFLSPFSYIRGPQVLVLVSIYQVSIWGTYF